MATQLPSEIIYQIAQYLPTLSSLVAFAQTSRRLYKILLLDDSHVFRNFVKTKFPTIETPPYWKDAAIALTSRSRALDRNALIGRFVVPPRDAIRVGSHQSVRRDNPTVGYRPAIDSYEVWDGERWADRKEVLAWGAGDELAMRVKRTGSHKQEKWLVFNDLDHISSYDDICGVQLLKPWHSGRDSDKEHLIFGRIRGDLSHIAISPDEGTCEYKQKFATYGLRLDRVHISDCSEPILAAHLDNGSVALYHTTSPEAEVQPFTNLPIVSEEGVTRHKYSAFLSPQLIAVGTGGLASSLSIFTVLPDRLSPCHQIGVDTLDLESRTGIAQKAQVRAIAPLNTHRCGGSPGDVFLAGWGDRQVRLHDLRTGRPYETTYRDSTDDNPVYSIQPFGHDRFLVGVGADAVLKIFDLRMQTSYHSYSYLDAKIPPPSSSSNNNNNNNTTTTTTTTNPPNHPRKDFTLFLSHQPPNPTAHRPARRARSTRSYRGAVYALSTPSPSSPTVYAGISDGVFRLDFASTDDLTGPNADWYAENLGLDLDLDLDLERPGSGFGYGSRRGGNGGDVVELSGYERPDPEDTSSVSRLRDQRPFWELAFDQAEEGYEAETGWDRRWVVDLSWRRRGVR